MLYLIKLYIIYIYTYIYIYIYIYNIIYSESIAMLYLNKDKDYPKLTI